MPHYTDQLLRTIAISATPQRIVSTVPSQTELLHYLGLEKEVIGITKFCIHPSSWFRSKERIGGTKQLNIAKIKDLKPDLILANKEENQKNQIEELALQFPVWVSDVNDLSSACVMIKEIGSITGREKKAEELVQGIRSAFYSENIIPNQRLRTAYLIWKEPYLTVGGDTFIHQMVEYAGFKNIFADRARYPQIEIEEINGLDCELLLLSTEPYPFKENHVEELKQLLPKTKILLVDGELFSWYGSRLLQAPSYFKNLHTRAIK